MKRTVVDLSFSFFITLIFLHPDDWPVVAEERQAGSEETAVRYLLDIELRRISVNIALRS